MKPASSGRDPKTLVRELGSLDGLTDPHLAGAALITELLLITSGGDVVPAPLTWAAQVRSLDRRSPEQAASIHHHELSRRRLLLDGADGGLLPNEVVGYLPYAMNDYGFASAATGREPVLASQRARCAACHFLGPNSLGTVTR